MTRSKLWNFPETFLKAHKSTGSTDLKSLKHSSVSLESSYITMIFLSYARSGKGMESKAMRCHGKRAWWDVDEDLQRIQRLCPGVFVLKAWKCGNLKLAEYVATLTSASNASNIMHILTWQLHNYTRFNMTIHHTTLWLHCDSVMITSWLWLLHAKSATNSKIETKLQWCHRCPVGEAFEVSQLFSLVAISCCKSGNEPSNWMIFAYLRIT